MCFWQVSKRGLVGRKVIREVFLFGVVIVIRRQTLILGFIFFFFVSELYYRGYGVRRFGRQDLFTEQSSYVVKRRLFQQGRALSQFYLVFFLDFEGLGEGSGGNDFLVGLGLAELLIITGVWDSGIEGFIGVYIFSCVYEIFVVVWIYIQRQFLGCFQVLFVLYVCQGVEGCYFLVWGGEIYTQKEGLVIVVR